MTSSTEIVRPRQRPIASGRTLPLEPSRFLQDYIESGNAAVAEPFKGITSDGQVTPGLFPIRGTGVPTLPIRQAAEGFLRSLNAEQRARASFPLASDAWRRWSNIHIFTMRHGVSLDELTAEQREQALALLRATLSPAGFASARDVMKLNETIAEITDRFEEYGEWLYWLSVFGTPSESEPWGWQIDGHHLIVNCLVLGDQIVLTPLFMGSEPTFAISGKYAGTRVFEAEEQRGLALAQSLSPEQRQKAIIAVDTPREVFTTAFRDNFELRYEGIRFDELAGGQQTMLLNVIEAYTGRMRPGHAEVRLEEVRQRLSDTYLAWAGGMEDDSVFYYRVHSPVILIEFDHEAGIALDNDTPSRQHIHTVVRTPNGNDYGMDLLRQHYVRFDHSRPTS
jgi:hypothetical protein